MNRALFLDRDGTILKEIEGASPETLGYLTSVKQVELIEGAAEAIAISHSIGYKNIIITNQSAIARGILTEEELNNINNKMTDLLLEQNPSAVIDDIFYSPYFKNGLVEKYAIDSPMRKPDIGMVLEAQTKHNIDISRSYMIGDAYTDIKCGVNAGLINILVKTGYGKIAYKKCLDENLKIDFIASNLLDAVQYIQRKNQ
ncbi:MAG TPA: HAD-IIIA family hydrolase [Ignavibacteria bacterium]|nr:HAD-IIIA family hydrolase [Ignavibacteria bacterium]